MFLKSRGEKGVRKDIRVRTSRIGVVWGLCVCQGEEKGCWHVAQISVTCSINPHLNFKIRFLKFRLCENNLD